MKKVKVRIEADERYPVYDFMEYENLGYLVEVDEETAERWKRVLDEWRKVQDEMEAAPSCE